MLELLLNYATLIIAVILFLGLIALLFFKRKELSKKQKAIIYLVCAIIIVYFIFIGFLTFSFGNTHPSADQIPMLI